MNAAMEKIIRILIIIVIIINHLFGSKMHITISQFLSNDFLYTVVGNHLGPRRRKVQNANKNLKNKTNSTKNSVKNKQMFAEK
jgi:hypothetical protein